MSALDKLTLLLTILILSLTNAAIVTTICRASFPPFMWLRKVIPPLRCAYCFSHYTAFAIVYCAGIRNPSELFIGTFAIVAGTSIVGLQIERYLAALEP